MTAGKHFLLKVVMLCERLGGKDLACATGEFGNPT